MVLLLVCVFYATVQFDIPEDCQHLVCTLAKTSIGGVVATVQSGATGGYGAAVISNVVRASSAISGIGIALLGSKPEVKQETEGKFKQHSIDKKCGKKD